MVTDQEPRYRLVDEDGNVVGSLFAETDGTLKLQEGTSGNDNEVSLTTQGALEVEQQIISGPIRSESVTHLDAASDSTKTTFSFSVPSKFDQYFIDYQVAGDGTTGDTTLAFEGDSGGNGLYSFFDESGNTTTGVDSIPIFTIAGNGFGQWHGRLMIFNFEGRRPSINHLHAPGRVENTAGFATAGGRDSESDITQIDLTTPSISDIRVDVWGLMES